MMKNILVVLLVLGIIMGCGKPEVKQKEEVKTEVEFYHFPLPEFSKMFNTLDFLDTVDFDKAVPEEFDKIENDVFKAAFALGSLTGDAIIATKSRNKTKLSKIAKEMIDYSKFIGLNQNILRMADELQNLITDDKWKELENTLDKYKTDVELSLYESQEYDLFTLLQVGGWTEGLNRITFLLKDNYNKDKTGIIAQKGILNSLINNLNKIHNSDIKSEKYYSISVEKYKRIKEIIYSSEDKHYTPEKLAEIFTLTSEIKASFQ